MTGQAALVTGSSRGIGLATAVELAREGFAIAVNGPADDAELSAALEKVRAEGNPAVAVPFDVADIDSHDDRLARIEDAIGPLTTLVNNAGAIRRTRRVIDYSAQEWADGLDMTLGGPWRGCKQCRQLHFRSGSSGQSVRRKTATGE